MSMTIFIFLVSWVNILLRNKPDLDLKRGTQYLRTKVVQRIWIPRIWLDEMKMASRAESLLIRRIRRCKNRQCTGSKSAIFKIRRVRTRHEAEHGIIFEWFFSDTSKSCNNITIKYHLFLIKTIFIIVLGDSSFNAQKLAMMKEGLKYVKGN